MITEYTLKYHQGPTSCTVTPFSLRPWNLSFPYFLDTLRAEVSPWLLAFLLRVNYQSRMVGFLLKAMPERNLSSTRLTILANRFVNAKSHARKTPLLSGYVLEQETTYYQSFGILPTCQQLIFIKCSPLIQEISRSV